MDNFLSSTPNREPCPKCGANPYSHEPAPGTVNCRCTNCDHEGTAFAHTDNEKSIREAERFAVRSWNRDYRDAKTRERTNRWETYSVAFLTFAAFLLVLYVALSLPTA